MHEVEVLRSLVGKSFEDYEAFIDVNIDQLANLFLRKEILQKHDEVQQLHYLNHLALAKAYVYKIDGVGLLVTYLWASFHLVLMVMF